MLKIKQDLREGMIKAIEKENFIKKYELNNSFIDKIIESKKIKLRILRA